jgi:magnesium chelatase subunit I
MAEIVARISQMARASTRVNQRSGVSVRASIANHETLVASALRRALRLGETEAVPRPSDLDALVASTLGKLEIEMMDDDEDLEIVGQLIRAAVLQTFRDHVAVERLGDIVEAFDEGLAIEVGPQSPARVYVALAAEIPALAHAVTPIVGTAPSPGVLASATELVLEGLHLTRRLNKDVVASTVTYRSR